MSERGDKGEGHAGRSDRSSSFGGHRGGGVGGAGKGGGGPSGGQPPLSFNRSFRKPGNGHAGHQRVVSQPDTTGFQPAPVPGSLQTPPRPPAPQNAPAHVPPPAPRPQHHASSGSQPPSMSPASENPANTLLPKNISHAAPRAPPKNSNTSAPQGGSKGESSKGFNLQFGSINMNDLPALQEGLKVASSVPVQPALKQQPQQQTIKDVIVSSQPNSVNPHVPSQVKRNVHVSPSIPNVAPPRPPVQPLDGMPMPVPFHHQQPQVSLQFGGHNQQMQLRGVVPSSLQMSMGLPGANAPQVPQQIYVSSIQMGDVTNVLISNLTGKSYVVDWEPHPSPGRGVDRPTSRDDCLGAAMDDDRWIKSGVPFSPGCDAHMDSTNGPAIMNYRGTPRVNHGVLRNPHGGLLVGPMPSIAPQIPRSGSDADRWQQKGLIPSPVTPMQIMHKAERKYIVGKISDKEEVKQRQLKAILNKLTAKNFQKLFVQVRGVSIDSVATLTGVVSQIIGKALMEPIFCKMYANFCFHLAGALPDFSDDNGKITFKRLLLDKCQEEFERGVREEAEADKTEEEGEIKQTKEEREGKRIRSRRRMLGNIRLIGELYKKRMLTERIMHECIKKLLGNCQNPLEENIEALCILMSTIGGMIDHPKAKEHMDTYFDTMQNLSTSQQLSSRVRFRLRDSIDLRKNKWQERPCFWCGRGGHMMLLHFF